MAEPKDLVSTRLLLARAYLRLVSTPFDQGNSRTVTLAKHGDYEVRLIELSPHQTAAALSFWIEFYDTKLGVSLNSSGCRDLGAAVLATDDAIAQAKRLAEQKEI